MNENYQHTVVYARVLAAVQAVEMQLAAAQSHFDVGSEKDPLYLIDQGVSATKVGMNHRRKLVELMDLVKEGRVKRLYVYDRNRLARDYSEYRVIAGLLAKMQVDVIFTGQSEPPFDKTLVMESRGVLCRTV